MQFKIDIDAVQDFNKNAPTIGKESFYVRQHLVAVEIYTDYYRTRNARLFIEGFCQDMQWNGDGTRLDWSLPRDFPYPKGLAQYKFRDRISSLAVDLWEQEDK